MAGSAATRVKFAPVEGAAPLFTPVFLDYLVDLHDRFTPRIGELLARRAEALTRAHTRSVLPSNPPTSAATTGDWHVPPVPADLQKPGIEISGPCSITSMFINALNPGPEGERAEGDLDDDEDSGGHRLVDSVRAAHNRVAAVQRDLHHFDTERKREYRVADGELPFFMHRERGLHLVEPEVTVDGTPVNAALLGTALTLFHAGRAQAERNQGIYFYLPKLEFAPEARLYRDVFDRSRERLPWLRPATIRAIVLVESLPCVYEMDEMLYELGAYAAGLNAARWDLKASIFEYVMADPKSVWPDRFKQLIGSGWRPTAEMARPENYPIQIDVPDGPITLEGTRRNCRMVIEYVEGWLNGRGAKGIDSLEGKPGIHPALMEDLATGRMSVAQIAQRIIHRTRETGTSTQHDFALVKRLLGEELADILARRQGAETHERYRKALKIAMRWIKNYTELNFKSLGAYTPAELDAIAAAPAAF